MQNEQHYFKEGWAYGSMARGTLGLRRSDDGAIFSCLAWMILFRQPTDGDATAASRGSLTWTSSRPGATFAEEVRTLAAHWDAYDFFFLHYKDTDKAGEDGDFPGKVAVLERLDAALPGIEARRPDVLVVTGDHASPAVLKGHSWHPVPVLLVAPMPRPTRSSASPSAPARPGAPGPSPPTTSCRS